MRTHRRNAKARIARRIGTRWAVALAILSVAGAPSRGDEPTIAVGGPGSRPWGTENIITALRTLGVEFTDYEEKFPEPGSADIIIIGIHGDFGFPPPDYRSWLDEGGDLIVTGGSDTDHFRAWASDYFNITDTERGWHSGGFGCCHWRKLVDHPANHELPDEMYLGQPLHMLAFLETPDTVLLGRNDKPNVIAAFRSYDRGGSFNYMAIRLGEKQGYQESFITPWVAAALKAAQEVGSVDCDAIRSIKAKCRRQRLTARIRTSLAMGTEVVLLNNGEDGRTAVINRRGKGKVRWTDQAGMHMVSVQACEDIKKTADCGG
ncbi:MAG: hypothetical protein C4547_00035 [Phycisphaerales bacterium]|nr:MAG: hypothetical protein C4547_00035 [Phycisphaerales bacterium]